MNFEPSVRAFFEDMGYRVKKIPEQDVESPDFLISDDAGSYLLELKTKIASPAQVEERKKALVTQGVHVIREPAIPKNTLSGIIRKATNQLNQPKAPHDTLRLVWLLGTGDWADAHMRQFEATIYGSTQVVDVTNGNDRICFFFFNSEFFTCRDGLDAAIVSTESEVKLLLNPLSIRYDQMKNSSLSKHFVNAVVDPIQLEKAGQAFLVEGDVDRTSKEAVIQYLRLRYRSDNIFDIPMSYISGTMVVSK